MDQHSIPHHVEPVETTTPEEDPHLLAIEALEARTIDDTPKPLNAPRSIPVPPREAPVATPPPEPKVIDSVIAKPVTPPVTQPTPPPVTLSVAPAVMPVEPAPKVDVPPTATATPIPRKPATAAEAIAEELTHAPTVHRFQFFTNRAAPRKPFIVTGIVVIIVALGIGAYFLLR